MCVWLAYVLVCAWIGRGGVQECGVGLGGPGCWREKRALCGEIKDVCECIDESVFSYCVDSAGALCLPDAEDESDGNEM